MMITDLLKHANRTLFVMITGFVFVYKGVCILEEESGDVLLSEIYPRIARNMQTHTFVVRDDLLVLHNGDSYIFDLAKPLK
jgi:hypothetical protein